MVDVWPTKEQPPFNWTPVDPPTTNPIVQDPVAGLPGGAGRPTEGEGPFTWTPIDNPFGPFDGTTGTTPGSISGLIDSLDPTGAAPGSPPVDTTDPTGGTSGDFDLETLEGIDQAIAQLESQIDTGRSGAVPDYSAFFQSPGYQFRQDEGIRAIDRSASARGQLMSGGTLRELQRYGQGLASSEFNNYANRLSSLAGVGQTAAFGGGQLGAQAGAQVGQSAANIGQSIMAGGTAQASGIIGANNAWQNAFGNAFSAVQQYGGGQAWQGGGVF